MVQCTAQTGEVVGAVKSSSYRESNASGAMHQTHMYGMEMLRLTSPLVVLYSALQSSIQKRHGIVGGVERSAEGPASVRYSTIYSKRSDQKLSWKNNSTRHCVMGIFLMTDHCPLQTTSNISIWEYLAARSDPNWSNKSTTKGHLSIVRTVPTCLDTYLSGTCVYLLCTLRKFPATSSFETPQSSTISGRRKRPILGLYQKEILNIVGYVASVSYFLILLLVYGTVLP
jgi:hypothetical protein